METEYDDIIEQYENRYAILKKDNKCGLWSYDCFIPPVYEDVFIPEVLGWIMVKKDGEWGYIDENNDYTNDMDKAFLFNFRG